MSTLTVGDLAAYLRVDGREWDRGLRKADGDMDRKRRPEQADRNSVHL